jgi:uncharacterized membrane protein
MKICPSCAEEIQDDAKKCKHCHSWLIAGSQGDVPAYFGLAIFLVILGTIGKLMPEHNISSYKEGFFTFLISLPFVLFVFPWILSRLWNAALSTKFGMPQITYQWAIVIMAVAWLLF